MSGEDGAVEAPKKAPVEPAKDSDSDEKAVSDAAEVDVIASKELAGAYQEAKNDADAAEKAKDGVSVRVDALEAFVAVKKESKAAEAEGSFADEQEELAKQEKEVAERLEKAQKSQDSQADKDAKAEKDNVDKKYAAAQKSNQ